MPVSITAIERAMAALNWEQRIIDQVVSLLQSNSDQLKDEKREVTPVRQSWFGGAPTAHRIGVNTEMAHQAVEEEFQKLADSLGQYSEAITVWGNEVIAIDANTTAEMTMRAQAVEQVHAQVGNARDEAADNDMGDGSYAPPAEPSPPSEADPASEPAAPADAPASQSPGPQSTRSDAS